MSAPRLSSEQKSSILSEYRAGVPIRVIADRHGVDKSYPAHLAKRRGLTTRRPYEGAAGIVGQLHLSTKARTEFERAASVRGLEPFALLRRLVETIAADGMFDAVLDDQA